MRRNLVYFTFLKDQTDSVPERMMVNGLGDLVFNASSFSVNTQM